MKSHCVMAKSYDSALASFRAVSREHTEATNRYRAREIGDAEFLRSQAALEEAQTALDQAERGESRRVRSHPGPAERAEMKRARATKRKGPRAGEPIPPYQGIVAVPSHANEPLFLQGYRWGLSDAAGNVRFSRYVKQHGELCRVDEHGRATKIPAGDRDASDVAAGYVAGCLV